MRTTISIDDDLFALAKHRAVDLQITFSDLVNRALRESLLRRAEEMARFQMVTHGAEAPIVHHEPADLAALLDSDDLAAARKG